MQQTNTCAHHATVRTGSLRNHSGITAQSETEPLHITGDINIITKRLIHGSDSSNFQPKKCVKP